MEQTNGLQEKVDAATKTCEGCPYRSEGCADLLIWLFEWKQFKYGFERVKQAEIVCLVMFGFIFICVVFECWKS